MLAIVFLKNVLELSAYRLQIFLVKYEYLQSLQLCEDQDISGKLKKPVCKQVLAIFTSCSENVKLGRFPGKISKIVKQ